MEVERLLKTDDAFVLVTTLVVKSNVRVINTDGFVRDEWLLQVGFVSCEALILQRVYVFELVDSEITREAGHVPLQEFLEVSEVFSKVLLIYEHLHDLLVTRLH